MLYHSIHAIRIVVVILIIACLVYAYHVLYFLHNMAKNIVSTLRACISRGSTVLRGHRGPIFHALWSKDNKRIITGANDGSVYSWEASTGTYTTIIERHPYPIQSIRCNANGSIVAASSHHCMTYDQGAGFIHLVNLLDHQTESPYVISCSHDENYVAVGTFAGNVYIWHRTSGSKLTTLQGHTQGITALAWSDDGTLLFSASYDGSTRIWDIATGTMLYTLRDTYDNYFMAMVIPGSHAHILNLRYDKHSATIVTGSILGTICFWDTRSGTQLKRCDDHTGSIQALELNRDGTLLASASSDNTVRLWNMRDKRCSHILGHQDGAHALAFSPDSTILATTNGKGTINIWDCATGSLKNSLHGHTDRVETLEFSTDSTRLLSSSRDCTARIWKVKHM